MTQQIQVHFLPELTTPNDLSGKTVAVIDVLRATTTICYALDAGAREVIPCLTIDEAKDTAARQAASSPTGAVVLGGERQAQMIDGFDLGNSPSHYTPDAVAGKTVVMTTTNGTKAMNACRSADRIYLGGLVNLTSLACVLCEAEFVEIVCAGTAGEISWEDALTAGAIVEILTAITKHDTALNDSAHIAMSIWRQVSMRLDRLADALQSGKGGQTLLRLGLQEDIEWAAIEAAL